MILKSHTPLKINIYGEGEGAPRYVDFATESQWANGRPLTGSLQTKSVEDLLIRSAPINETTAAEMARVVAPGGRINVLLVEGSEGPHIDRLLDALGDRVKSIRVRVYTSQYGVLIVQTTIRLK